MKPEYVTVHRSDPEFFPLLVGSFSEEKFAKPVRTFGLKTEREKVTFQILPKQKLRLGRALFSWLSLPRQVYFFAPLLTLACFLLTSEPGLSVLHLLATVFGLLCFVISLTLYSDYNDYVMGVDRVNENNFSRPLLVGEIRPYQALLLAKAFLGLALLCALAMAVYRPLTILFSLLAFAISFIVFSGFQNQKMKSQSGWAHFLLSGPLLSLGLQYVFLQKITGEYCLLGCILGLYGYKADFCKNMRDIFFNGQARVLHLTNRLGFDRSKLFYSLLSFLQMGLWSLLLFYFSPQFVVPVLLLVLIFEIYVNNRIYYAPSFLSSRIAQALEIQRLQIIAECGVFMTLLVYL